MSEVLLFHLGAGVHARADRRRYKELLENCFKTFELGLKRDGNGIIDSLVSCSQVLEADDLTNTGYGSSLNIEAQVEGDSSLLYHDGHQYHQAAVACCKRPYPITESVALLRAQAHLNRFGITRPVFIVDTDSYNDELVSERARKRYDKYVAMMSGEPHDYIADTIGVLVRKRGQTVSASSSGGNMFKAKGRVGCALVVGASHYQLQGEAFQISLMSSGNGEDILGMDLCRYCCHYMLGRLREWPGSYSELLTQAVKLRAQEVALKLINLQGEGVIYVGIYGLLTLERRNIVIMCHSTEGFIVGYYLREGDKLDKRLIFSSLEKGRDFNSYEKLI